jgi:uncharacterized protein
MAAMRGRNAQECVGGAQLTAIGALSRAKLAVFEWETKQYRPIPVDEQVEVRRHCDWS